MSGRRCWCGPRVEFLCESCEGEGCVMCDGGGWTRGTEWEIEKRKDCSVTTHRDVAHLGLWRGRWHSGVWVGERGGHWEVRIG
jgi:hypothetical protein